MSVVPYRLNHEIVYHDANYGIVVLHNNQLNQLELVSTENRPGSPDVHADGDKCPNCGFLLSESSPKPFRSEYPYNYVHNNYFKLLAGLEPTASFGDQLPQGVFNQGYFDRFFKKIDPFVLGSGAHAQVYKVAHVLNEMELGIYAVKRISIGDHAKYLDLVLNEVLILYELSIQGANENNLIRYNHVWVEMGDLEDLQTYFLSSPLLAHYPSKIPYVFILQQYCAGGHLEDLVRTNFQKNLSLQEKVTLERQKRRQKRSHKTVPEPRKWLNDIEIWKMFHDVANGVHYLHSRGILHRDLKPSNCLLDEKYIKDDMEVVSFAHVQDFDDYIDRLPKVLVSDFGEGKFIDKQKVAQSEERQGNTGTLEFTAPELFLYASYDPLGGHRFTFDTDIYSLGLILCWLCVGTLPFSTMIENEPNPDVVRTAIGQWYVELTPESFGRWFKNAVRDTGKMYCDAVQDFELLVYLMLKGEGGRVSSGAVLEFLDAMKWSRFVALARRLSEQSVVSESVEQPEPKALKATASISSKATFLGYLGLMVLSEIFGISSTAKLLCVASLAIDTFIDSVPVRLALLVLALALVIYSIV